MNASTPNKCRCVCGGRGCGCCEGTKPLTPESTANRPGLSALRYRIGTHGSFLQTMKASLSSHRLDAPVNGSGEGAPPPTRPLAGLRLRDDSDPSIALLDAWATVADVLSFYQERIANEGYLRTATEMRSMFELSRLVGYQPRPGVASSVYLAYMIDANTTQEIVVPQGSRAQTVPAQDELPQSFETSQDLKARAAWNRLGLRQTEPQQWKDIEGGSLLYLAGTQTRLKAGDPLLIAPGDLDQPIKEPLPYRVISVDANVQADRTAVRIERWDADKVNNALGARLQALHGTGPQGVAASKVRNGLDQLGAAAREDPQFATLLTQTLTLVRTQQREYRSLPAPQLKPWLAAVAEALDALSISATASNGIDSDLSSFAARIGKLITPPSKPRANALELPRSLATSFETIGDAGLKLLGAVAPTLKTTLAPALAGYEAASPPQPLRVWALRLQAGLFGRTFPRRTQTESVPIPNDERRATTSTTIDAGEWPIVVGLETIAGKPVVLAKEAVHTLYLDASHNGIAPGPESWVLIDARAVPVFKEENIMTRPVKTLLVAPVKTVLAKVSRADYGGTGDSTGLVLGVSGASKNWIEFLVKDEGEFKKKNNPAFFERDFQLIRRTAVYTQSEPLMLAERPIEEDLCSAAHDAAATPRSDTAETAMEPIELDGLYAGLEAGRFVMVSGERADVGATRGVFASEPVMITSVVHDVRAAGATRGPWTHVDDAMLANAADEGDGVGQKHLPKLAGDKNHTFIWIDKPLAYCYRRDSVAILGNVVKATHGETRNETLGNGDGAKPLQRFELKQSPLTHLPAPTPQGAESTLRLYVNDVRWREVAGFVGQAPTDRVYRVQTDDQGKTTVQFGNGREGARLPTGFGNVKAMYRNGIGRPGNAAAGQIQQLATRPLGVRDVTSPLRASGGADRESRDQVRRNAPLAVKSLDRLVSTPDYADFSRTFAGIGKADAQEISDGRRSLVHVTVAGIDDIPIDADSDLMINLRRALRDLGDPFQPLSVDARELRLLIISAKLRIDPDYLWEPVVTKVRAALLDAFGFERRELAQGVASSDVLSVIQSVTGVVYVDLDVFGAIDTVVVDGDTHRPRPFTPAETADAVAKVITNGVTPAVQAKRARRIPDGKTVVPAQLAILSGEVAETLVLNQMT